nr:SDR family oxidoreductase [Streptomyces sp. LRE541]
MSYPVRVEGASLTERSHSTRRTNSPTSRSTISVRRPGHRCPCVAQGPGRQRFGRAGRCVGRRGTSLPYVGRTARGSSAPSGLPGRRVLVSPAPVRRGEGVVDEDGGSILMTGSNASLKGFPGWSVYAGSKAVQQAWARVWLNELRDRRIRVNVLTPGQVATAKQEELFDEETKRQFESLIPRGTMGRPDEIATVALFLASDDSSYVNGLELTTDGGTTVI